ncbi:MAG TPA: NADH-quinone oxidoreductase subunit L [Mycobacteriales bacterium]|jgi:NADH-quinone oxidoreductase subunit L|nr:NADH-quinone oxidoreductase subunit L [Mycobacteriales bacterium]
MTHWAWLIPALPAFAAVLGLFMSRWIPGGPAVPAVAGTAAALGVAIVVLAVVEDAPARVRESGVDWSPIGGMTLHVGTRMDGLAAVIAVMVCIVALLVQIYSTAYMAGDPRYSVYAAEVSLFTAAMLLVVVASDLFELLIGWEVMGLCSYLLIGHYWQTEGARAAAVKAFVTTRIGDTGFLFGIFVLGFGAHTFEISGVVGHAASYSHTTVTAGALLLLAGVVGKSAQFPLHVWLPDAMAGPTPISALIHAATMVAAGIFVLARLYPVFLAAPVALTVLGIIACITMLGAALAALADDDLKRVLAWSTVSQLAYMAAGLAVGGWTASVYHLLTHAAFKALLFLAAGSVLRTVGTNLMSEMGGLWRAMPVTTVTAAVGALALAGVPPFAGAFSKDGILGAARERGGTLGIAVFVVGLVTLAVTAAYVTRLFVRTFLGDHRGRAQLHESPLVMTGPLVLLATFVLALGLPALPHRFGVSRWLDAPAATRSLHVGVGEVALTTVIALVSIAAVAMLHRRRPTADPVAVLGPVARPLARAFYVDDAYDVALVRPVRALARGVVRFDNGGVDAAVVDVGRSAGFAGGLLRRLQGGNIQAYLTGLVAGVLVVVISVSLAVAR